MRDTIHAIVTKINDKLYENSNRKYDRAKDFYIENKSDDELTYLAVYLIQYSKYLEGRKDGDTNKNRKEKLLRDIDKIRDQFYQYSFMGEELTLLREIRLIVKQKEIKSKKQQVLSLCKSIRGELLLIDSSEVIIQEFVEFLKKALPEIDKNPKDYNFELEYLKSLL